jgi:hypothetical protein
LATLKELGLLHHHLVIPRLRRLLSVLRLLLQHQLPAFHSVGVLLWPWQRLHLPLDRLQLLLLLLDQHRHQLRAHLPSALLLPLVLHQQEPRDPLGPHRRPHNLVRHLLLLLRLEGLQEGALAVVDSEGLLQHPHRLLLVHRLEELRQLRHPVALVAVGAMQHPQLLLLRVGSAVPRQLLPAALEAVEVSVRQLLPAAAEVLNLASDRVVVVRPKHQGDDEFSRRVDRDRLSGLRYCCSTNALLQ